jgi:hypothetical protein
MYEISNVSTLYTIWSRISEKGARIKDVERRRNTPYKDEPPHHLQPVLHPVTEG